MSALAVVCVGKLREAYWRAAADEYKRRLGRYGGIDVLECPDLAEPKNASAADIVKVMEEEGRSILLRIKPRDHVVALCVDGKRLDSQGLAARLQRVENGGGVARVVFVIGGSNGLSSAVIARADDALSFSAMTFPHQLARVMLLEQLYRARKILSGETYHK